MTIRVCSSLTPDAMKPIGTPLSPHATRVMLLGSGELGKEVLIALQRLGVETIYQTLALADNLDAVANLFLGRELIADWRALFAAPDLPFYLVSLPAFMARRDQPGADAWAELREAQAHTARTVPHTALAITIDTTAPSLSSATVNAATLTLTAPVLASLAVTPANPSLAVGATQQPKSIWMERLPAACGSGAAARGQGRAAGARER